MGFQSIRIRSPRDMQPGDVFLGHNPDGTASINRPVIWGTPRSILVHHITEVIWSKRNPSATAEEVADGILAVIIPAVRHEILDGLNRLTEKSQ